MYNTKLIHLISTFSIDDKRKLKKWIKSEIVNKNTDIVKFYEFIDSKKTLTERTLSKEKAFEYLYPNEPFNDLRIRHLIWMTTEIIEEFIVYNSLNNNKDMKNLLLAKYYSMHELYLYANQTIEENSEKLDELLHRNAEHHLQQYNLNALYFQINSKNDRSKDFKFQRTIDHATMYMLIETLKNACVTLALQKISEFKFEHHLLEAALKLIENPIFLKDTVVRIYYHIFLVLRDENEQAFHTFIQDLNANNHYFTPMDLKELYLLAINFCVKKSNQNLPEYTKLTFDLYIYAIEHSFLIERNEISRFSFTNVVTLGIKLKEFNKTKQFIQRFSKYISKEHQKNTVDFNNAKMYYAIGKTDEALRLLLSIELKDILWDLNAKYITLKILFENKDMQAFSTYLKALNIYIKRKKNIGYHHTYFTDVVKNLTLLKEIYKKPELYKAFRFSPETPDIDWFNKALQSVLNRE